VAFAWQVQYNGMLEILPRCSLKQGNEETTSGKKSVCFFFYQKDNPLLGGGFKHFLFVHPYLGKIPILSNIFQMG